MRLLKTTLLITLSYFLPNQCQADYSISGRINLSERWQPQIFLAAINKLDDYYNPYPDLLVDAAFVKEDGSFHLTGDNLPKEKKYYRLYLIKSENSEFDPCLHLGGNDHNFIHLVLDSDSKIFINGEPNSPSLFGDYTITGDVENGLMKQLTQLVYPSFHFNEIKFTTELKLSQDKLNKDLINFADTCSSTIVSLAALVNTDFDNYFDDNTIFYNNFSSLVESEVQDAGYIRDYHKKLQYYSDDLESPSNGKDRIIALLIFLGVLSVLWNINQYRKLANYRKSIESMQINTDSLTSKEKEILLLITEGKSNKEIASAMFVELSTVKTHINKLYSKLNISKRKEAVQIGKTLHK